MDVINVADVNEEEDYMDTCNSSCKKKKKKKKKKRNY